jgi:signal transduction histidine kinase
MDLPELLTVRRELIIQRWMDRVRGSIHPAAMPRLELVDHLPGFLDEVADALSRRSSPDTSVTAATHGLQRLALGFNLDSVVREYGALRNSIIDLADAERVVIAPAEYQVLFDCVITGIADAVSEYERVRDAEMQRQANEHFAFIAHELRNPLGSALGALRMLKRKTPLADERSERMIERGLTRMHELIEATLKTAQIGAGVTLHREPVMLRQLLADAEATAHASADEKNIVVSTHAEMDATLFVDRRLVMSALTNLIRNAVKFTHDGTKVEIRARVAEERVTIEVEDRCGGLPSGTVERAFAPFAQMGVDRTGFGLGLAIAKQAADAHGGSIRVQNLPDMGCIFVLELPLG